jgi:hypothetical protein
LGNSFGKGFLSMVEGFSAWSQTLSQNSGFQAFMQYLAQNAPVVGALFDNLGQIFTNLIVAMAPYGSVLTQVLVVVTSLLAQLNPTELQAIAVGIGLVFGVMGGSVTASIVGIIGLVGVIERLWQTNETFRKVVTETWTAVSGAVTQAWTQDILPALRR